MRIRIDLSYDGSDFHGWASQPGLPTVQAELEGALGTVLRLPDPSLTCAGRTDTGVHARGQVVHLDLPDDAVIALRRGEREPLEQLARRLNGLLPPQVRVTGLAEAPPGFDARFSALWRRYSYRIADRPEATDPLTRGHVLWWPRPLDVDAMNAAAAPLVGEHDFAAFCRRREGATTIRTLLELRWERHSNGQLLGTVRADAFCHSMVRALTGCLIAVGEGRRPPDWARGVLAAGVRDSAVTVAAARGLTLEEVGYPAAAELATRAGLARQRRALPAAAGHTAAHHESGAPG